VTLDAKRQEERTSADGDEMQFHMSMVAGHELAMTDEFHRLTGAYGDVNHIKERAAWVMTNGSHRLEGNMWQSYPPGGHHFRCFWV
jgi:hypothetical protein